MQWPQFKAEYLYIGASKLLYSDHIDNFVSFKPCLTKKGTNLGILSASKKVFS